MTAACGRLGVPASPAPARVAPTPTRSGRRRAANSLRQRPPASRNMPPPAPPAPRRGGWPGRCTARSQPTRPARASLPNRASRGGRCWQSRPCCC
ncbi:hypothetical protein ABI59_10000 [Acidobacteria bacterium Mor1]|nr:hypothetical protein ABI59_10000 [Acidobacteria bacterium Mor1]